ncbi:MAG: dTDP-glucose 4,6-dehydratase [candidate division WOR-3 bacterium]|nr:dTDP-glucose 4,6-dehydratase [candidate division WOR-3 bacterium]
MKNLLVTGGAGFIGSNFIHYIMDNTDYNIFNLDKLTYAGNLENLRDIEESGRYTFIKTDITDMSKIEDALSELDMDIIINFAAESHVDRSILNADDFIETNITGTYNLIKYAEANNVKRYMQVSTDEVYGSLEPDEPPFTEINPLDPTSPYAASKASADLIVMSYIKTHKFPGIITRCSNNYGPYQFPEKFIPLVIYKAVNGEKIPLYGDGLNVRDWIHVKDHCRALAMVMENGREGEVYNIGAENEKPNIEVIETILDITGASGNLIEYVRDRKAHDRRYAIDNTKIREELGFEPRMDFASGIEDTVKWYRDNSSWLERCMDGSYRKYYENNYSGRS